MQTSMECSSDVSLLTPERGVSPANFSSIAPDSGKAKRERLVSLLRGYFASPVIATLGELGMAERMLAGEFSVADWSSNSKPEILSALFQYLHSVGILTRGSNGNYALTASGRTVIRRNGAFSLLMSYSDYFQQLPSLLAGAGTNPSVNRSRNVRGSGQLHSKKFFPAAFGFFPSDPPRGIIDIGCGDGCFLESAQSLWPDLVVFGVDLSEIAVETTKKRLAMSNHPGPIAVAANGHDVAIWSQAVPAALRDSPRLIISFWFVAHEFSNGSPDKIKTFFSALHQTFPRAQVLLGEINKISSEVLAEDHDLSIMPEFLLFHALSAQGVLSWETWKEVLGDIPYLLKEERRFDDVAPADGEPVPASFLWLLQPQ